MEVSKGTVLATKDGHNYTNAVVISVSDLSIGILTDFGNIVYMSQTRLEECFEIIHWNEDTPSRTLSERIHEQVELLLTSLKVINDSERADATLKINKQAEEILTLKGK